MLDTFAAAIHQARTGEALPWWQFSRERKRRALEARRGSGSSRAAPPAHAAARAGTGRAS